MEDVNLIHATPDEIAKRIMSEENPFMREVIASGYQFYTHDYITDTIVFANKDTEKRIARKAYQEVIFSLKIIHGLLPNGKVHAWISEADGSAERFRKFIAPEPPQH